MFEAIKLLLCKVLKIPPEPSDPMGAVNSVRVFRASINYYYYKLLGWALSSVASVIVSLGVCAFIAFQAFFALGGHKPSLTLGTIEMCLAALLLIGGAIFKTAIGLFLVRLDYEMRWYKLSDRSLRIREGIFTVREMTMTFANIQDIEISQGPIQRLFGISDLKVDSAGGGAVIQTNKSNMQDASAPHIAYFRGVDNASEIMALMRERLKVLQDAGLGHPEDEHLHISRPQAPVEVQPQARQACLLKMLEEAKSLRLALEAAAQEN